MVEFNAKLLRPTEELDNSNNQEWWEKHPMIYDWNHDFGEPNLTREYFEKIDNLFGESHRLCNNPQWPNGFILENFIPYAELKDKAVLEIGCGAGLVASHIARNGAKLTAIDLTQQAVNRTRKRFELYGLNADIRQMDAEKLEFKDAAFEYVISWGVIHHSGNMKAILDEIHRVLKPGGKAYIMIYNKKSLRYQVYCRFWLGIVRMQLIKHSLDEINGSITDGFIARHLTEPEFLELTGKFSNVRFSYSDEPDTTSNYLLGPLRRAFKPGGKIKQRFELWLARNWGWYMETVLTK